MTGTTDPVRMSAERKVADAIILERALNVVRRNRGYATLPADVLWYLEAVAQRLRAEAEVEWAERDG